MTINIKNQKPILVEEGASELVFETLQFFRKQGEIALHAFVIMPDHVHLLITLREDVLLSDFVRRFKSYVARNLEKGPLWVKGCWSKVVSDTKGLRDTSAYIHNNPVKALLAHEPQEYVWSSARDYLQESSLRVDFWWGDAAR